MIVTRNIRRYQRFSIKLEISNDWKSYIYIREQGGTESPFSWRWTTVTWRVLNFPCRFAVGYQLEDRNVGKNPISHSISCPVREIQPRTGATLQETLVGESASISATPVYHLMTTISSTKWTKIFSPLYWLGSALSLRSRLPFIVQATLLAW